MLMIYDVQVLPSRLLLKDVLLPCSHMQLLSFDVIGVPVRTINRPGSQLLGANGRDDGPTVSCLFKLTLF